MAPAAAVPGTTAGTSGTAATTPGTGATVVTDPVGAEVGLKMSGLLYDIVGLQRAYDDATTAVAQTTLGTPVAFGASVSRPAALLREVMPAGFLAPLPAGGKIKGPPGGCPAAADPTVTFGTAGGKTVTPDLLAGLQTMPRGMVTMAQTDPSSLSGVINSLVRGEDPRLKTASGWNEMLWDQLKRKRAPAASLLDYQLWNASPDIERQVSDLYLGALRSSGASAEIVAAFSASSRSGWYASTAPSAADALASMDIQAVMSGSVRGTVHEQRSFRIPGAGSTPTFGPQTGEGTVTADTPDLGTLAFDVKILLDKFDAAGRAIGGTVTGSERTKGYDVKFTFLPDGRKEGEILKAGQTVGQLTMSVDHERFESYVEARTKGERALPSSPGFARTGSAPAVGPAITPPVPAIVIPKVPSPPAVTGPPPGISAAPGVTGPPAVTGPPSVTGPPAGIPPGFLTPPPGYPGGPPGGIPTGRP